MIFVTNSDSFFDCDRDYFIKPVEIFLDSSCPVTNSQSYCYTDFEEDNVVIEICGAPEEIARAEICSGVFETSFGDGDNLTIYEGPQGSGTTGDIVFGPADGDLSGEIISANTKGVCLIFVVNSGFMSSCDTNGFFVDPLTVTSLSGDNPCNSSENSIVNGYCYGNNETDNVAFEVCGGPTDLVNSIICSGSLEINEDDLTVYEGQSGSAATGNIIFGPESGNLVGTVLNSTIPGQCLIFVINSDTSGNCISGSSVSEEEIIVISETSPTVSTAEVLSSISNVYPNPFRDELFIDLESPLSADAKVEMIGIDGRSFPVNGEDLASGSEQIRVNTAQVPAGTFILQIRSDGKVFQEKIVKLL